MVHLVQIMITTDQFSQSVEEENNPYKKETGDFSIVLQMLHEVRDAVGFASDDDGSEGLSGNAVWHDLKIASIPFLRAAAGNSQDFLAKDFRLLANLKSKYGFGKGLLICLTVA